MRAPGFAVALAGLLICGGAAPAGQQQPAGASIAVDFFAYGPDGSAFDLRPEEVTIKIDGKPRPIRSLRYVQLSTPPPGGAPVEPETATDPPYGTNAITPDVRWVTIIVDHESIRRGGERNAVNTAIRYISSLGPRDRVSYVTMPNGAVEIDFTTKHHVIVDALRKFVALSPSEQSERDRSCRSRLLLNAMASYLEGLAPLQGPKHVVLLSSGLLDPRRDAPLSGPPGPCEIQQRHFQEVSTAASLARAHFFVVLSDDLHMDPARQVFTDPTAGRFAGTNADRAGLESLAGVTGGDFMRIVGPDDPTLVNLTKSMTGYYIATFDVAPGERNGAMHRVDIAVTRERIRVRTNGELHLPRGERAASVSAKDMLRNGNAYGALPIRATALPSAGDGDRVKVLVVLEPVEPGVKFAEAVFGLIDTRDRLIAQWTANESELAAAPVITAGAGPRGAYRLRVAAVDSTGRRGTTEFEFVAQLTEAPPLALSALALGVSRDGNFVPKLLFGSDQACVGYFEIYASGAAAASATVRIEVADSPDGRALTTANARVVRQGEGRSLAIGALPIASLPPGDYVVRAIVSVDARPVGRIHRTLRKVVGG